MIALEPASRPTFDVLLHTSRGTVFPESFYSFLHNYAISTNELPSPSPFAPLSLATGQTLATTPAAKLPGTPHSAPPDSPGMLPGDSDNRLDRIWSEFDGVEMYLLPEISTLR